ncbi:MAG: GNAT family N-acetyltransferase [Chloroflexota bacterium]
MMVKDLAISYWPTDEASAREFLQWKYEPPYAIYNYLPQYLEEDLVYHLDPANNMYSIYREGELVGYCSFGQDGRVTGGDYGEQALDIGLMIKPELTGQGLGSKFVKDVIRFARTQFKPNKLRVTILTTNLRAIRVWEKSGFQKTQTFKRERDELTFLIMTKDM